MGNIYNIDPVGIGISPSFGKLDVVDPNSSSPMRIGGSISTAGGAVNMRVGADATHRYLSVQSDSGVSGVQCGGVLVSDTYSYANPPLSTIVVKNSLSVGAASQVNIPLLVNGKCVASSLNLSGKATTAATIASDSGRTLVTKGYLDTLASSSTTSFKVTLYNRAHYLSMVSNVLTIQTMNLATSTQLKEPAPPTTAKFLIVQAGVDTTSTTEITLYAGTTNTANTAAQRICGFKRNAQNTIAAPAIIQLKAVATGQMGFHYNYSATPSSASYIYVLGYIE
jgi:hypothetical protein